jgi:hypothetical protein
MQFYQDTRIPEEHRNDLLREAEHYRLVKQALEGRPHRTSLQMLLFRWMSRNLISWVCTLQKLSDRLMHRTAGVPDLYACGDEG